LIFALSSEVLVMPEVYFSFARAFDGPPVVGSGIGTTLIPTFSKLTLMTRDDFILVLYQCLVFSVTYHNGQVARHRGFPGELPWWRLHGSCRQLDSRQSVGAP
jgi:hypothetical protein